MLMVQTGEAHVAVRVPPEMVSVLERDPNIEVVRTPSVRTIYIGAEHLPAGRRSQEPVCRPASVGRSTTQSTTKQSTNSF